MARIRLEIDEVALYRPKKRWNLYFVVLTEHPEDPERMVLTTLPGQPFRLSKRHENTYAFDTDDHGSEGLLVLSREMPASREMNVHIYLRHSRRSVRDASQFLKLVGDSLGEGEIVNNLLGLGRMPWLVVSRKAMSLIGKVLESIPDRDFGFLSAFERFGPEFESQTDIDRKKEFTGDASLVYSWSVEE